MGHLNFSDLKKIEENTDGVQLSKKEDNLTCVTCIEGKQTRLPFKSSHSRAYLLETVHSDIWWTNGNHFYWWYKILHHIYR